MLYLHSHHVCIQLPSCPSEASCGLVRTTVVCIAAEDQEPDTSVQDCTGSNVKLRSALRIGHVCWLADVEDETLGDTVERQVD